MVCVTASVTYIWVFKEEKQIITEYKRYIATSKLGYVDHSYSKYFLATGYRYIRVNLKHWTKFNVFFPIKYWYISRSKIEDMGLNFPRSSVILWFYFSLSDPQVLVSGYFMYICFHSVSCLVCCTSNVFRKFATQFQIYKLFIILRKKMGVNGLCMLRHSNG